MTILPGQSLFRGTLILLMVRILLAVLGLVQYLVIAYFFGIGARTDAYIIAQSVPLLFGGIGEAVLSYTFLPVFIEYRGNKGSEEALVISNTIFFTCSLVLGGLAVLTLGLAPLIISGLAPGFTDATHQLASRLLMIMAPLIVVRFLCSLLAALFNSVNEFVLPAITGILPPVGAVAFLVLGAGRMGIASVPVGLVCGSLLQFVILLVTAPRYGVGVGRRVALSHPGVKQIRKLFGPRLLDFSLNGLNLAVDRWFASLLGAGYLSALTFAQRILRFPNTMVIGSLGRTILPVLSSQRSLGEEDRMRSLLSKSIRLMGFVTLPMTLFVIFFRVELIRLLFQRGAFDPQSTGITAYALLFYSFGIFAYSITPVLKVAFFSVQDTMTPLKVSGVLVLANALLDYSLMQVLGHGGIALSTSLVLSSSAVWLWILLRRRIGDVGGARIVGSLGRVFLVALLIALALRRFSPTVFALGEGQWRDGMEMTLLLVIGGALFAGISSLLKVPEFGEIVAMARRERRGREAGPLR